MTCPGTRCPAPTPPAAGTNRSGTCPLPQEHTGQARPGWGYPWATSARGTGRGAGDRTAAAAAVHRDLEVVRRAPTEAGLLERLSERLTVVGRVQHRVVDVGAQVQRAAVEEHERVLGLDVHTGRRRDLARQQDAVLLAVVTGTERAVERPHHGHV